MARLARPWLSFDLGAPHRVLSFAPHRPGFATASRIVWREVRNADLHPGLDVQEWFRAELAAAGLLDTVAMLTSRDIGRFRMAEAEVEGITAACLATVGLGNAERIGRRRGHAGSYGTINIAVRLSAPLTDTALIEALSIAAEARTAAVMEAGLRLPTGLATGTGTDCLAIAAPPGAGAFAGLHTATGEALGRAVHDAVAAGAADWMAEHDRLPELPA